MLLLLLLLAAPQPGGTLVVRLDQEPPSLDKLTDSALAIDWLLERKVLESMAELGAHPDYALRPALATDWSISPDQLTFTFHIRRGVNRATTGCTTMAEPELVKMIAWLRAAKHPCYVLLPMDEYERKWGAWNLPDPEKTELLR